MVLRIAPAMNDSQDVTNNNEWYDKGLRFSCTQCGNCCTGPTGYVWFTEEEAIRMAEQLGITVKEFYKNYTRKLRGRMSLIEHKNEHGYDCIFLDRKTSPGKALCKVYKSRPAQCGTWPFWPENLKSQRTWESIKKITPCPGMGNGQLIPIEDIRIQRDSTPADI